MKKGYLAAVVLFLLIGGTLGTRRFRPTIPTPITDKQEKMSLIVSKLRQEQIKIIKGPKLAPDNKTLSVTINNNTKILFSLDKDVQNQILSLQLILKKVRMEGKQVKLIDLTLNSPHVVF